MVGRQVPNPVKLSEKHAHTQTCTPTQRHAIQRNHLASTTDTPYVDRLVLVVYSHALRSHSTKGQRAHLAVHLLVGQQDQLLVLDDRAPQLQVTVQLGRLVRSATLAFNQHVTTSPQPALPAQASAPTSQRGTNAMSVSSHAKTLTPCTPATRSTGAAQPVPLQRPLTLQDAPEHRLHGREQSGAGLDQGREDELEPAVVELGHHEQRLRVAAQSGARRLDGQRRNGAVADACARVEGRRVINVASASATRTHSTRAPKKLPRHHHNQAIRPRHTTAHGTTKRHC